MRDRNGRPRPRTFTAAVLGVSVAFGAVAANAATPSGPSGSEPLESDADPAGTTSGSTPTKIALDHLRTRTTPSSDAVGLLAVAVEPLELVVDTTSRSEHSGVTHVYVQQRLDGIDVVDATANVAVTDDGRVAHDPSRLVAITAEQRDAASELVAADTAIDAVEAVGHALDALGVTPTEPLKAIGSARGSERLQQVSEGGVAVAPFQARLVHLHDEKRLVLGWEFRVDLRRGDHLQLVVAADDGRELRRDDYAIHHTIGLDHGDVHGGHDPGEADSADFTARPLPGSPTLAAPDTDTATYRVFEFPTQAPSFGPSTIAIDPASPTASPFGWHDTDGVEGADSTLTIGNNVDAYLDTDSDNVADIGSRPDGGIGLDFDASADFTNDPDDGNNPLADVINLFYANNWAHDFLYAYGFDEASGNFQTNNYGNGGLGGDAVRAEGLDGYADPPDTSPPGVNRNNANFSTPGDGSPPRMQMYAFLGPTDRSASFDNGIVLHEYAHGWSVRLTGGRHNPTCLNNAEQMGEGWSDFAALIATMQSGDDPTDRRGIATWAIGQDTDGRGIRQFPYSTDMSIDPRSYGDVASASIPHGVGSIWAAMLWDLTWNLVDRHGFDADPFGGDGGNNLAMQLVTDGLKLQPCSPGFVDGRDAILAADQLANDGANECLVWEAFAKRGLGWSADQGSPLDPDDGLEAFDLPPHCPLTVSIDTVDTTTDIGDVIEVDLTVRHRGSSLQSDVVVDVDIPTGVAARSGSATCDRPVAASVGGDLARFVFDQLAPNDEVSCSFDAEIVAGSAATAPMLTAGFESGLAPFEALTDDGPNGWISSTTGAATGARAARATNPDETDPGVDDQTSDQSLVTLQPFTVAPCTQLEFVHRYQTENNYDGGVVEIRSGEGRWVDLGSSMILGGYDQLISTQFTNSAISGRQAFAGSVTEHRRTIIDLDEHVGDEVSIRFRYVSDATVDSDGWSVDDVRIAVPDGGPLAAGVTSSGGASHRDCAIVSIVDDGSAPTTTTSTTTTTTTTSTTTPPVTTTPTTTPPASPDVDGAIDADTLRGADRLGPQG